MPDPEGKPSGGPPARRIDRDALERIIQRAAELQAGDVETGDSLTEQELLKLGAEVGIDGRFLRQALYEESAGARESERGFLAKWFGPGMVAAGRVVPGDKADVETALERWMVDSEALTVKRRLPDRTVWEKQRGFFAEMKRGLGAGGRQYLLARANDVSVTVTQLESGYCHVELAADIASLRSGAIRAGVASSGGLLVLGGAALTLASAVALAPITIGLGAILLGSVLVGPPLAGRMQRTRGAQMQLALEQVLDRLEYGEIKPRHRGLDFGGMLFGHVALEVRRAIESSTRPRPKLPPGTPKP